MGSELPFIGITTYGRGEEDKFPIPANYVDSVRRAGGIAVLIPPGQQEPQRLLSRLDGLVLAGGGDIDPACYGGQDHESIYMTDSERDQTEIELARFAVEQGFPTLGICRGMQVLNVAMGGTLYEHLPDVVGEEIKHRLPPREPTPHAVSVKPESFLASLLSKCEFDASSWHHQALRKVADGFQVVAYAPDGTIEAIEMPAHPWLVAVQWHPELTAATDPNQQKLFDEFVAAVIHLRDEKTARTAAN